MIALDNSTLDGQSSGKSLTFAHTCAGSNRLLVVSAYGGSTGTTISGITYNGVAMTYVGRAKYDGNSSWVYTYILIAPATGSNNVVVSYSIDARMWAIAVSYTGCAQSDQPHVSGVKEQDNSSIIEKTLAITESDCWLHGAIEGSNLSNDYITPRSVLVSLRTDGKHDAIFVADSNGTVGTGSITGGFNDSSASPRLNGLVLMAILPAPPDVPKGNFLLLF